MHVSSGRGRVRIGAGDQMDDELMRAVTVVSAPAAAAVAAAAAAAAAAAVAAIGIEEESREVNEWG